MRPRLLIAGSITLCFALLTNQPAAAQISFTVSQLPQLAGIYEREYVTSNSNPATLIGTNGGPQVWDFSQNEMPGDVIRRLDIVSPTNGGYGASFPGATYAERFTNEDGSLLEWDYYSINTNSGRYYYGSYTPQSGTNIYSPLENDIPAILGYGTNWTYNTATTYGSITLQFSASAKVDAFGTIILPQLGQFPTLRVAALNTTVTYIGSQPFETTYMREYYWLVPGIGMAAHILSTTDSTPPPTNFTAASEVRRVFETNVAAPPSPGSVSGLRLQLQQGSAVLTWSPATNVSAYQVQGLTNLASTNWQVLASPVSNSWSEPANAPEKFYRVLIEP